MSRNKEEEEEINIKALEEEAIRLHGMARDYNLAGNFKGKRGRERWCL